MSDQRSPRSSLKASVPSSSLPPLLSSQPSSFSTALTSIYTTPPAQTLHHNAHIIAPCTRPSSSSSSSFPVPRCCKWVAKFFIPGKLSMEAEEGFLLHQRSLEGLHDDGAKLAEKPKRELRFAAKIAAAMDADGFIGVKDSVCADDAMIEMKHGIDTHYCVPSSSVLQRKDRPPSKQARPLQRQWRRWRLFRRIRRTRVLFACFFQKARKALTPLSKRTSEAHDKFIK